MVDNLVLSLVLPVYNVSKYIRRCVESIYNNISVPLTSFEVIFVDDESPDNSKEIIESYKKTYSNIKLISQKNKKAGGARNTGIKNACGKYIWFIDPDDTIVEGVLDKFIPMLSVSEIDIIMCNNNRVYDDKRIITDNYGNKNEIVDGINHFKNNRVAWGPCISIYRRQFILSKYLFFEENVFFEDIDWVLKAQLLADKILCLQDVIYNYYKNDTSQTTTKPSFKKTYDWFSMGDRILNFKDTKQEVSSIIEAHSLLVYKTGITSLFFLKPREINVIYDKFLKKSRFDNLGMKFISNNGILLKFVIFLSKPIVLIYGFIKKKKIYH